MKTRRRRTTNPKRRKELTAARRRASAAPGRETKVARVSRELREALEQQAATSEVLRIISGSPGELQPVFQAILANAVRLCEAKFGDRAAQSTARLRSRRKGPPHSVSASPATIGLERWPQALTVPAANYPGNL
jgi:adenylate cyclase